MRLAVNMLVKVLLQYMDLMLTDKDFFALWQAALGALQVSEACWCVICVEGGDKGEKRGEAVSSIVSGGGASCLPACVAFSTSVGSL